MNFGMTNTLSTFATLINSVFKEDLGKTVVLYLDDIIVFSKDKSQHLKDIKKVLNILSYNNLYAKPSKCEFFKSSLTFLGHVISNRGVSPDPKKVSAIEGLP